MSAGLNEAYIQESLLNSRAISMSSGLDAAHGQSRRQKSRSNRYVTLFKIIEMCDQLLNSVVAVGVRLRL